MIFASTAPAQRCFESLGLNPLNLSIQNIQDFQFHVVRISDGKICSMVELKNDCIVLNAHIGVSLYRDKLSVTSLKNQAVYLFEVKDDGQLYQIKTIGWTQYEDDELFLNLCQTNLKHYVDSSELLDPPIKRRRYNNPFELDVWATTTLGELGRFTSGIEFENTTTLRDATSRDTTFRETTSRDVTSRDTTTQQALMELTERRMFRRVSLFSGFWNHSRVICGLKQRILSYLYRQVDNPYLFLPLLLLVNTGLKEFLVIIFITTLNDSPHFVFKGPILSMNNTCYYALGLQKLPEEI